MKVLKLWKTLESHELPGCAGNAALAVATGSAGGSWVLPVLQSDTCVGVLGWDKMKEQSWDITKHASWSCVQYSVPSCTVRMGVHLSKEGCQCLNFHQELWFVWVPAGTVVDEEQNALQLHIASVFPFVKAFSLIRLGAISLLSGNNHKMSKSNKN